MVAAAPSITLQRKLEIFDWLAEHEDLDTELTEAKDELHREFVLEDSYAEIAKNIRAALDALYDGHKAGSLSCQKHRLPR